MPEWMKALLAAHGSLGFADSLAVLAGRAPSYESTPHQTMERGVTRAGRYSVDARGRPIIGLSRFAANNYGARLNPGVRGYRPADRNQKFGDYVVGHEFGHLIASGGGDNFKLAGDVAQLDPNAYKDEQFADDFQNAVQFLRPGRTDTLALNPRSRRVMNVLLRHDPYKQHVLNKPKGPTLEALLNGSQEPKTLDDLLQTQKPTP